MKPTSLLPLLSLITLSTSKLLLSYDAAAGDPVSNLGLLNLERERGTTQSANTDDLYIKTATDPDGTPAAHVHRAAGLIRAEYHSLKSQTLEDHTYYIGYQFQLGSVEDNLALFQWKAYENTDVQNIPLDLEFDGTKIQFNHADPSTNQRVPQWEKTLLQGQVYTFGLIVHAGADEEGWAQVYVDGKRQTMMDGTHFVNGSMWPGQTDPKFGAYRGEAGVIDTYIYGVQISESESDITLPAFHT